MWYSPAELRHDSCCSLGSDKHLVFMHSRNLASQSRRSAVQVLCAGGRRDEGEGVSTDEGRAT
jgi:hypothetical protein